ncbi:DGQHR domain-containing protein [Empedobacter brevis]
MTREEIESFKEFQSPESEKETALFFNDIGLECISLCFKIKADDGFTDITDVDGIYLDRENKIIIIYDDSTQKNDNNSKIATFFLKCQENKYEQQIYDKHKDLPHYPIKILYIDKHRERNKAQSLASIDHAQTNHTAILFKDDFEYFKNLASKFGKWSRNDLYNLLDIRLPNAHIEIDAIKIYIGNTPAYVYASKPHDLLNYAFVSRRRNQEIGYQRMVDYKRIDEISGKLISGEISGFMNSILLNSTIPLEERNKVNKSHTPSNVKLIIPNHFSSCRVVDGQHRLLAFSQLKETEQSRFSLPVVLMDNLSDQEEMKMFLEINKNAKPVDPNLEYEIISHIEEWGENSTEFLIRIAVLTVKELCKSNPFKDHVHFGLVGDSKQNKITLKGLVDTLIKFDFVGNEKNIFGQKVTNKKEINQLSSNLKEIFTIGNKILQNKDYYLSNRGIDLVLGFISNLILEENFDEENNYIDNKETILSDKSTRFFHVLNANTDNLNNKKLYGGSAFKGAYEYIRKIFDKTISDSLEPDASGITLNNEQELEELLTLETEN